MRNVLTFISFCVLCYLPAVTGIFFRPGEWYQQLNKPSWTPPGWLFGPVWTMIYLSIAVAGFLVWRKVKEEERSKVFSIFAVQLMLNALWSYLFFGIHSPGAAFAEICVLWTVIIINIVVFARVYKPAGLIMIPYALWVGFASALNCTIYWIN